MNGVIRKRLPAMHVHNRWTCGGLQRNDHPHKLIDQPDSLAIANHSSCGRSKLHDTLNENIQVNTKPIVSITIIN